jgi:hypothetical protein
MTHGSVGPSELGGLDVAGPHVRHGVPGFVGDHPLDLEAGGRKCSQGVMRGELIGGSVEFSDGSLVLVFPVTGITPRWFQYLLVPSLSRWRTFRRSVVNREMMLIG